MGLRWTPGQLHHGHRTRYPCRKWSKRAPHLHFPRLSQFREFYHAVLHLVPFPQKIRRHAQAGTDERKVSLGLPISSQISPNFPNFPQFSPIFPTFGHSDISHKFSAGTFRSYSSANPKDPMQEILPHYNKNASIIILGQEFESTSLALRGTRNSTSLSAGSDRTCSEDEPARPTGASRAARGATRVPTATAPRHPAQGEACKPLPVARLSRGSRREPPAGATPSTPSPEQGTGSISGR